MNKLCSYPLFLKQVLWELIQTVVKLTATGANCGLVSFGDTVDSISTNTQQLAWH